MPGEQLQAEMHVTLWDPPGWGRVRGDRMARGREGSTRQRPPVFTSEDLLYMFFVEMRMALLSQGRGACVTEGSSGYEAIPRNNILLAKCLLVTISNFRSERMALWS